MRVQLLCAYAYGIDKVCLPYAGGSEDEHRIELGVLRMLCHHDANRARQSVGISLDEVLEVEARVELWVDVWQGGAFPCGVCPRIDEFRLLLLDNSLVVLLIYRDTVVEAQPFPEKRDEHLCEQGHIVLVEFLAVRSRGNLYEEFVGSLVV